MMRWMIAALAIAGVVVIVVAPHVAGIVLAAAVLVLATAFVGMYARSAWRQTAPGRAVMGLIWVVVAMAAWVLWVNITGIYPGSERLRAALYLAGAVTLASLLRALMRER